MAKQRFVRYLHHGVMVAVRSDLKGKHREHCSCYQCARFHPNDRAKNCRIANALYAFDQLAEVTTPVWECQQFKEKANGEE